MSRLKRLRERPVITTPNTLHVNWRVRCYVPPSRLWLSTSTKDLTLYTYNTKTFWISENEILTTYKQQLTRLTALHSGQPWSLHVNLSPSRSTLVPPGQPWFLQVNPGPSMSTQVLQVNPGPSRSTLVPPCQPRSSRSTWVPPGQHWSLQVNPGSSRSTQAGRQQIMNRKKQ